MPDRLVISNTTPIIALALVQRLDLAAVHAAMAYYYDHRSEIDGSIEDDEAFAEAFRRDNPSLLQAKLQDLEG